MYTIFLFQDLLDNNWSHHHIYMCYSKHKAIEEMAQLHGLCRREEMKIYRWHFLPSTLDSATAAADDDDFFVS